MRSTLLRRRASGTAGIHCTRLLILAVLGSGSALTAAAAHETRDALGRRYSCACAARTSKCGCELWKIDWQLPGGKVWASESGKTREEVERARDAMLRFDQFYAEVFRVAVDEKLRNPSAPYCKGCARGTAMIPRNAEQQAALDAGKLLLRQAGRRYAIGPAMLRFNRLLRLPRGMNRGAVIRDYARALREGLHKQRELEHAIARALVDSRLSSDSLVQLTRELASADQGFQRVVNRVNDYEAVYPALWAAGPADREQLPAFSEWITVHGKKLYTIMGYHGGAVRLVVTDFDGLFSLELRNPEGKVVPGIRVQISVSTETRGSRELRYVVGNYGARGVIIAHRIEGKEREFLYLTSGMARILPPSTLGESLVISAVEAPDRPPFAPGSRVRTVPPYAPRGTGIRVYVEPAR